MLFHVELGAECYHHGKWFVLPPMKHGVRAVSRKHALTKALKIVSALPFVVDREAAGMEVEVSAKILEEEKR